MFVSSGITSGCLFIEYFRWEEGSRLLLFTTNSALIKKGKLAVRYFNRRSAVYCCIALYPVISNLPSLRMKATVCDHASKGDIEQYFHLLLFIMLYKVALTFNSVDE